MITVTRPFRRGFSLIEMMVSMGIGGMILLTAASVLGSAGNNYDRVGGAVGAEREARALLNQLASDLASGVFHPAMVAVGGSGGWPLDRFAFLVLQPPDAQSDAGRVGDLCVVHYYVKDQTIGGKTVRCLMRGLRESSATFAALRGGKLDELLATEDPADDAIAFGVVSFEAQPMRRQAGGALTQWAPGLARGPDTLDVRLIIARRDLQAKLATPFEWDGSGSGGRLLGPPAEAQRNKNLEIYGALLPFGSQ